MKQNSIYSHTWGGIFWFDLPLGLILVYLFNSVIKKSMIENLPQFLNRRFSGFDTNSRNLNKVKAFVIVVFSLLIGIISHIVWDKLTHKTVRLIDEQEHYHIFWEANSVIGAAIIAAVILKMPLGKITEKSNILFYWLLVSLSTASVVYIRFLATTEFRDLGVSAISGFFIGLIVASVADQLQKKNIIRTV